MKSKNLTQFLVLFFTLESFYSSLFAVEEQSKLYIAYLGEKFHDDPNVVTALHQNILTSVHGSKEDALKSMVYSYKHGFSGFAARLTESQAKKISELPEVKSVTPNRYGHGSTTRSWDFLGLSNDNQPDGLLSKANFGDGAIIGMLDSGIWPESRSFDDTGYGPIPSRWKGKCQVGVEFNEAHCNRKVIGARFYTDSAIQDDVEDDFLSPRDNNGHGTHTASTAAGSLVANVSSNGIAAGNARGGAHKARIAIYKVLWGKEARAGLADIVKAFDDAINDGVDIISFSIVVNEKSLLPSVMLHAVKNGITVVTAAGNDGPVSQTVGNDFPWVVTVAASTMDRSFPTLITLGNNQNLFAQSLFSGPSDESYTELVAIEDGCDDKLLNRTDIAGKIILCHPPSIVASLPTFDIPTATFYSAKSNVKGLIFAHYSSVNILESTTSDKIPFLLIDFESLNQINRYMSMSSNAVARIETTQTILGSQVLAPRVAAFTSRGPSSTFPGLIKPDITAPGVSILAATKDGYILHSGTSMACPHVTGVVALLKSLHPDWSPAAIKSALTTTASINDAFGMPIETESIPRRQADPFDFGGGHINPTSAADPGLVYDISLDDYSKYFTCHTNATDSEFCLEAADLYNLNLPSISVPYLKTNLTVIRTVTNVGDESASYKALVEAPPGVDMTVEPNVLQFDASVKMQSFKVLFANKRNVHGDFQFGSLSWVDGSGKYKVRIPIAVRGVIDEFYTDI